MQVLAAPKTIEFSRENKAQIILECGHVISWEFSDDSDGEYVIRRSYTCYACEKTLKEKK